MYIITFYALYYYEEKLISLFAHFKHTIKIYTHNFTHFIKNKHK